MYILSLFERLEPLPRTTRVFCFCNACVSLRLLIRQEKYLSTVFTSKPYATPFPQDALVMTSICFRTFFTMENKKCSASMSPRLAFGVISCLESHLLLARAALVSCLGSSCEFVRFGSPCFMLGQPL